MKEKIKLKKLRIYKGRTKDIVRYVPLFVRRAAATSGIEPKCINR